MKNYTKQEIEERYQKLPPELQEAMYSFDVADKIFETGKKYGLSTDKIGVLAEEVGYIMLGLSGPKEFIKELSDSLGVDSERVKNIASEINHKVFAPIRGMLKRTHDIEITEEDIQRGGEEMVKKATITPTPSLILPLQGGDTKGVTSIPTIPKSEDKKPEDQPPTQPLSRSDLTNPAMPQPSQTRPQPSWVTPKPAEPKSFDTAPDGKSEPKMIPPAPRPGPRIPPIDLRSAYTQPKPSVPTPPSPPTPTKPAEPQVSPKPAPKPYTGGDPYKEPVE